MKRAFLALSAAVLFSHVSFSAEAFSPEDPHGAKAWSAHGLTQQQRQSVFTALHWGIENKFIPGGALLIIHRGEPVFREGFGFADLTSKKPFTADAPCRIASVTKPHTATLMA